MRGDLITEKVVKTKEETIELIIEYYSKDKPNSIEGKLEPELLEILKETLETENLELLEQIDVPLKYIRNYGIGDINYWKYCHIADKYQKILVAFLDKIYHIFSYTAAFVTNFNSIKEFATPRHLNFKYTLNIFVNSDIVILKKEELEFDLNYITEFYEYCLDDKNINPEYFYLGDKDEYKTLLVFIMTQSDELNKKYDLTNSLEKLMYGMIIDEPYVNDDESVIQKNWDLIQNYNNDTDNYSKISNILGLKYQFITKFIKHYAVYYAMNKSKNLDTMIFLLICNKIQQFELDKLDFSADLFGYNEDMICEFISKFKQDKVLLFIILSQTYSPEIKSKISITIDELLEHIFRNPTLIKVKDFLLEKSDICDLNYTRNEDEINSLSKNLNLNCEIKTYSEIVPLGKWFNNIIKFAMEYFKDEMSQSLKERLYFVATNIGYYEKIHFNMLNCVDAIEKYTLSNSYLYHVLEDFIDIKDIVISQMIKTEKYDDDIFVLTSKFFGHNLDFIQLFCDNQKDFSQKAKVIMILAIASKNSEYLLQLKSTTNKTLLSVYIYAFNLNPECIIALVDKLKSTKLADRKDAVSILKHLDCTSYKAEIQSAFDAEKNQKLKDELQLILSKFIEVSSPKSSKINSKSSNKKFDENIAILLRNEKLIKLPLEDFSKVKNIDGSEANIDLVKASLIAFAKDNVTGLCPIADEFVANFELESLHKFACDLSDYFINKADTKQKWIIYYCSIYGGEQVVDLYINAIDKFLNASRSALASETIRALVLNPSPRALILVEEYSRKSKKKSIKRASIDALSFVAEELNLTLEELADKIVPNFGFDEEFKVVFDYGTRKFNVFINSKSELEVVDEKGKVMKNLPKVTAKDDDIIAQKSFDEFKIFKKAISDTIKTQSSRLELAITTGRAYKYENFVSLFIKNPIMYQFATTLIFGIYDNDSGKLNNSFIYMGDGTFTDINQNAILLEKTMLIALVHPSELGENLTAQWNENLEDYELKQPILQLDKKVYFPDIKFIQDSQINLDETKEYLTGALEHSLFNIGYVKSAVQPDEKFYYFTKNTNIAGIKVCLEHSGIIVSQHYEYIFPYVTLIKLTFTDEKNNLIKIDNVPKKIICEFYETLSKVNYNGCIFYSDRNN